MTRSIGRVTKVANIINAVEERKPAEFLLWELVLPADNSQFANSNREENALGFWTTNSK